LIRKEDLVFEQIRDDSKEPYYIVNYNNEKWYPKTVKKI
jgi:hypothetical protein